MSSTDHSTDDDHPVFSAKDLQQALESFYLDRMDKANSALSEMEQRKAELVALLRERIITPEEMNVARSTARLMEAARRGEREKQIFRFPNQLTTDHGRAINNGDPDWPESLIGVPKQVYDFWKAELQPLGFRLKAQIVDFPEGMPGDIGFTMSWD